MKLRFFGSVPRDRTKVLAVLALLFVAALARYCTAPGDDLAASYMGCRLIAAHDTANLYSYDPSTFSDIDPDDDAWHAQAKQTGFEGFLHPYVQTPLWAWSLQPLCTHLRFVPFRIVFTILSLLSILAILWLVARFWTPSLLNPLALALLFLIFSRTEPFRYAMVLMQTHVLYLFLTIASLLLAERRRALPESLAGILLALAAAVKITPGFLIIYWLLTRRYRAALSATLASAVLLGAAILITGPAVFSTYITNLHRVAGTLLVSENNQSFAAWLMGRYHPADELDELISYVLPPALRIGSNLLVLASIVAGGLIDRRSTANVPPTAATTSAPPLGAMFAIVGITLFTPIAWTHYYIILLPPVMMLLDQFHTGSQRNLFPGHGGLAVPSGRRPYWILAFILLITLLNIRPLAPDVVNNSFSPLSPVRSTFYSGVLCLIALALAAWQRRGLTAASSAPAETTPLQQPAGTLTTARQKAALLFANACAPGGTEPAHSSSRSRQHLGPFVPASSPDL